MAFFWRWVVGGFLIFIEATIAAAYFVDTYPDKFSATLGSFPVVNFWSQIIDFQGKIFQFPKPVVVLIVVSLILMLVIGHANKLQKRDEILEDERVRMKARKGG
jgi:uncharacterized membrane protein